MNEEPVYLVQHTPDSRNPFPWVGVQDMSRVIDHLVHNEPFEAAAYCLAVKAELHLPPYAYVQFVSTVINVARAAGAK